MNYIQERRITCPDEISFVAVSSSFQDELFYSLCRKFQEGSSSSSSSRLEEVDEMFPDLVSAHTETVKPATSSTFARLRKESVVKAVMSKMTAYHAIVTPQGEFISELTLLNTCSQSCVHRRGDHSLRETCYSSDISGDQSRQQGE